MVIKGKALLSSKTFWFNLLAAVVAIASIFGFADFKPSGEVTEIITVIVSAVNIFLRLKTQQPITKLT
jgi:hypothetical protein